MVSYRKILFIAVWDLFHSLLLEFRPVHFLYLLVLHRVHLCWHFVLVSQGFGLSSLGFGLLPQGFGLLLSSCFDLLSSLLLLCLLGWSPSWKVAARCSQLCFLPSELFFQKKVVPWVLLCSRMILRQSCSLGLLHRHQLSFLSRLLSLCRFLSQSCCFPLLSIWVASCLALPSQLRLHS